MLTYFAEIVQYMHNKLFAGSIIAFLFCILSVPLYAQYSGGKGCGDKYDCYTNCTPLPVVTVSAPVTAICLGDSVSISASGADSYLWSTSETTAAIVAEPAATTVYTVTGTSSGGCTAAVQIEITVNLIPVLSITGADSICSGETTSLLASGASAYAWSSGAATPNISVTPVTTTTYSVTGSNAGCSATDSFQITVSNAPNATITAPAYICTGGTAQLETSCGAGPCSILWSTAETTQTISVSPLTATTYSVILTDGGCSDTASVLLDVYTAPSVSISGNDSICSGESVTLSASGASNYSWNTTETASSISVTPAATTTYSVTGSNAGCSATDSFQIIVSNAPNATITAPAYICAGGTAQLETSCGAGPCSILWSTAETTETISVSPLTATTYSVILSDGGCSDTASVLLDVYTVPSVSISGNDSICAGESVTLTAGGATDYSWNTMDSTASITFTPLVSGNYTVIGTNGSCADTADFFVNILAVPAVSMSGNTALCEGDTTVLYASGGGSYLWSNAAVTDSIVAHPATSTTYSVTVSNLFCSSTASINVVVSPVPLAVITGDSVICQGNALSLTASGGITYEWSNGSTSPSMTISPSVSGNYSVTVSNGNCADSASTYITVFTLPIADAGSDTTIFPGESAYLNGSGGLIYSWTPPGGLSCTDCPDPVATPDSTTVYTLTVTDANGCSSSDQVEVRLETNCGDLFVPNVFSPNGDGNNDSFTVLGNCIESITLMVFDRWGEKIFEGLVPGASWNGEYNGQILNAGVYSYYYSGTLFTGEFVSGKGNITLIR